MNGLQRFIAELRRRHVLKVAVFYGLVAWLIMQVGEVAFEPLGLPDWTLTLVIVVAILFFPLAMILAWAFDVTPQGVVRTPSSVEPGSTATTTVAEEGSAAAPGPQSASRAGVADDVRNRSIVVLPFDNMSREPDNEYLSDGISEDLIIRLSKVEELRVISRTSAWRYKDGSLAAGDIGLELGVAYLLTGSVRRSGNRLRIAAELIDTRNDDHIWAESYDREAADLFDIQSEVAASILHAVGPRLAGSGRTGSATLTAGATSSSAPTDLATYEAFLRGRHHWNLRTPADLDRSVEALQEAAARDPSFMLAHAGLADTWITLAIYGERAPHEVMPLARQAADRALALEPGAAEALTARACVSAVYEWDWQRARKEFEDAVKARPAYVTARMWYAMHHLLPLRRFAEARHQLDAALAMDPLSATVHVSRAALAYYEGDHDRAVAAFEPIVEQHTHFGLAHMLYGLSLLGAGELDRALLVLARAREVGGGSVETTVAYGRALAAAGSDREARGLLARLRDDREEGYVSAARVAQLEAALGDHDQALASLARAVEDRAADLVWLDVIKAFDGLRSDERFQVLRERILSRQ
ncbi:MAG TPA: tetratricopeptide repeat protein [Longimicrobiales bacterium]|nr:tetratricopeptide repeat protein [Longimicrobiales bacterium]